MPGRRQTPGALIRAAILSGLADDAECAGRGNSASPASIQSLPTGTSIAINEVAKIPARLTKTTTPGLYDWVEVLDQPSEAWPSLPGGRAGIANAFEVNLAPNLDGQVVFLTPTATDDFRFYVPRIQRHSNSTLNVKLTECGPPDPISSSIPSDQAKITLFDYPSKTFVSEKITNNTGECFFNLLNPGNYFVQITKWRFKTIEQFIELQNSKNLLMIIGLHPIDNYVCCGTPPISKTLFVTDASGTRPLYFQGGFSPTNGTWRSDCFTFNGAAIYYTFACTSITQQWVYFNQIPPGSDPCAILLKDECCPGPIGSLDRPTNYGAYAVSTLTVTAPDAETEVGFHATGTWPTTSECKKNCFDGIHNDQPSPITGDITLKE